MAQYRFAWPPVTKTVIGFSIVAFLGFLLPTVIPPLGEFANGFLFLSADNVVENNAVWTVLSYAFFHPDFVAAIFSALAFWLFGGELLGVWGHLKFWLVQLGAVVAGGVLALVLQLAIGSENLVMGYHAGVIALLTAFCRRYWERKLSLFVVEVKGKWMLAFFLGLNVVLSIFTGMWAYLALDAGGLLAGWFAGSGPGFSLRALRTRFNKWKARRHLKVVRKTSDGEWIN